MIPYQLIPNAAKGKVRVAFSYDDGKTYKPTNAGGVVLINYDGKPCIAAVKDDKGFSLGFGKIDLLDLGYTAAERDAYYKDVLDKNETQLKEVDLGQAPHSESYGYHEALNKYNGNTVHSDICKSNNEMQHIVLHAALRECYEELKNKKDTGEAFREDDFIQIQLIDRLSIFDKGNLVDSIDAAKEVSGEYSLTFLMVLHKEFNTEAELAEFFSPEEGHAIVITPLDTLIHKIDVKGFHSHEAGSGTLLIADGALSTYNETTPLKLMGGGSNTLLAKFKDEFETIFNNAYYPSTTVGYK